MSFTNFLFLKFAIEPSKGLVVHDHVLFLKIQAEAFGLPLLRIVFALYITPSGMNSLMVSTVRCFQFLQLAEIPFLVACIASSSKFFGFSSLGVRSNNHLSISHSTASSLTSLISSLTADLTTEPHLLHLW